MRSPGRALAIAVVLLAMLVAFAPRLCAQSTQRAHNDPKNRLWSLVSKCPTDSKCQAHCDPNCRHVDDKNRYLVAKDWSEAKPVAYLIIPTVEMPGIESEEIFKEPFLNLWEFGWQASKQCLGRQDFQLGLAINSQYGRSENQLHIHVSCVHPDVSAALKQNDQKIKHGDPAHPFELKLRGHVYEVVRVTGLEGDRSPFQVVRGFPHAKDHMADQSIAVVGTETVNEFYVLDTFHHDGTIDGDPPNRGSAEKLLNQDCSESPEVNLAPAAGPVCWTEP
jgi:CDP-diacylglycerol pyrophosphatase